MSREIFVDDRSGRKCYLDVPSDLMAGEELTLLVSLHGGGSVGAWQREYFPAYDHADEHRLVIATPSCATKKPFRHWTAEADDGYLVDLVEAVVGRFGPERIRSFWMVGHSQGGMTCHRLLAGHDYFAARVDGWLSLSGGRIGPAERAPGFGPPRTEAERAAVEAVFSRLRAAHAAAAPRADLSFIFATGEHEIASLPDSSPWAERYGAGARVRLPDVVDDRPGRIHDRRWDGRATPSWGGKPAPGTARIYVYPGARDGRLIADVVRMGKGHTEGLEPRITEELVRMMAAAPGGKLRSLAARRV